MAVSKKMKRFYFALFEKPEVFVANLITKVQENRTLKKNIDKTYKLTKEQKRQIKEFWKPYCHVSPKWAQYYAANKCNPKEKNYEDTKITSLLCA